MVDIPNDPMYHEIRGDATDYVQWELRRIKAENTWEITTANTALKVGIIDHWRICCQPAPYSNEQVTSPHPEFSNGVLYNYEGYYGGHGVYVAGLIGAITNNNAFVASLAHGVKMYGYSYTDIGNNYYRALNADEVDIINMSLATAVDTFMIELTKSALLQEVPVIASAGNASIPFCGTIPCIPRPASYYFSEVDGGTRVIGVSATDINDNFVDGWNYSTGSNPISNPTTGFVDIAAPGKDMRVLWHGWDQSLAAISYGHWDHPDGGTSFSAPLVTATVALILSVNNTLTPKHVYDILVSSTDKVGQYSYNYSVDPRGWNQRMGYGRLNAYKAVKAALPAQYSSHGFSGNLTLDSAHIFGTGSISSSVTLTIPSGKVAVVDGTLNGSSGATLRVYGKLILDEGATLNNVEIVVESGGELIARGKTSNKITLNSKGIVFKSGSYGEIDHCVINNATRGIDITSSNPKISNCSFTNNSTGIYLAGGSTSQTQITGNTFSGSNYSIASYYSSPTITGNTISDSQYGFYGVTSPAVLTNNVFDGNTYGFYLTGSSVSNAQHNIFSDHIYGIYAESPSTATVQFNNLFLATSWDYGVRADASAVVIAPYNYWGSYPPGSGYFYATGGASITYTPAAPSAFPLKALPQGFAFASSEDEQKVRECAEPLLDGFRQEEDPARQHSWLSGAAGCYLVQNNYRGFMDFLAREVSPDVDESDLLYGITLDLEALFLVQDGNYEEAVSNYAGITQGFSESNWLYQNALFGLGYIHTVLLSDPETGGTYFEELVTRYPESGLSLAVHRLSDRDDPNRDPREQQVTSEEAVWRVSTYPNPFNPTTVISYQLPETGMVRLAVYDILGREVALLVNGQVSAGTHQMNFDGRNLSSGIYLYRLQAGNQVLSGKMILMK